MKWNEKLGTKLKPIKIEETAINRCSPVNYRVGQPLLLLCQAVHPGLAVAPAQSQAKSHLNTAETGNNGGTRLPLVWIAYIKYLLFTKQPGFGLIFEWVLGLRKGVLLGLVFFLKIINVLLGYLINYIIIFNSIKTMYFGQKRVPVCIFLLNFYLIFYLL